MAPCTLGTQPRGDVRRPRKRAEHVLSLSHTPGLHVTTHTEKLTPASVPTALGARAHAAHVAYHQRLAPPKAGIIPLVSRRSAGRHDTTWPRTPITNDTVRLSGGQGPTKTRDTPIRHDILKDQPSSHRQRPGLSSGKDNPSRRNVLHSFFKQSEEKERRKGANHSIPSIQAPAESGFVVTALGDDEGAGAPAGTLCAHSPGAPPRAGCARPPQGDTSESKEGSDRHADTDRGGQGLVPSRLYQMRDSQAGSGPWARCSIRGVLAALQSY